MDRVLCAASTVLLATKAPTKLLNREFRFVPYGSSFVSNDARPTVSCDGRIPGGVSLELTHWTDNETPDDLYADTSTEMALILAKQSRPELNSALILNNHYDTDGVLSVWACLEPEVALEYADLLIQGAESGDFGEWTSDEGVKLDCALGSMLHQHESEEDAFKGAFRELPDLLYDLRETGGKSYQDLWEDGFANAMRGWQDVQDGKVTLEKSGDKLVLVKETASPLSPYALHRGLMDKRIWEETTRILRMAPDQRYQYEKIGHGWVQKLKQRHNVPSVDAAKLVSQLNSNLEERVWTEGGSSGLVAICRTTRALTESPERVMESLLGYDSGC